MIRWWLLAPTPLGVLHGIDYKGTPYLVMEKDFLQKALYELLYNNVLLPRTHEIDRDDKDLYE